MNNLFQRIHLNNKQEILEKSMLCFHFTKYLPIELVHIIIVYFQQEMRDKIKHIKNFKQCLENIKSVIIEAEEYRKYSQTFQSYTYRTKNLKWKRRVCNFWIPIITTNISKHESELFEITVKEYVNSYKLKKTKN